AFFFFQAEDGIRDFHVTGVQTCALPISPGGLVTQMREVETILAQVRAQGMHTAAFVRGSALSAGAYLALACQDTFMAPGSTIGRSEERRGGKECSARGTQRQEQSTEVAW